MDKPIAKIPPEEVARKRMLLAYVELGACISDMGNLLLQATPSKMKLGGIVVGLQRAMLAVANRSFAELDRDPQLQATEFGSNHVYMDPLVELLDLLKEFLVHVPDETPFKAQVIEMCDYFTIQRPEVEQSNGIGIRSKLTCTFTYKNYKGEVEQRRVRPVKFYYGATEWYPEPGWLLEALDLDKDAMRAFSTPNMTNVVFS